MAMPLIEINHIIKKWNDFYDTHPLEGVDRLNLEGETHKPVVKNSHDLGMVLYVANNDIMQGVVRPKEYALVLSKKVLKTKQIKIPSGKN